VVLEDDPKADIARVPLMKAAIETGDYHLAIAVMQPELRNEGFNAALRRRQSREEDDDLLAPEPVREANMPVSMKLAGREGAVVSRDLGLAFEKTNSPEQALIYLRRAYWLETDAATKTQINKEVQRIRAGQRRLAANLARQPLVHSELEQNHVVRPRMPGAGVSSPPRPRPAARKGASQ